MALDPLMHTEVDEQNVLPKESLMFPSGQKAL